MGVDPCRCGRIGMAEAGGDGGDRYAGVDHQGGVRVAQAVDGNIRQIVRSYEITEPTPYRIGVDRHTVGLRE